jgi:hypothetical protein
MKFHFLLTTHLNKHAILKSVRLFQNVVKASWLLSRIITPFRLPRFGNSYMIINFHYFSILRDLLQNWHEEYDENLREISIRIPHNMVDIRIAKISRIRVHGIISHLNLKTKTAVRKYNICTCPVIISGAYTD